MDPMGFYRDDRNMSRPEYRDPSVAICCQGCRNAKDPKICRAPNGTLCKCHDSDPNSGRAGSSFFKKGKERRAAEEVTGLDLGLDA